MSSDYQLGITMNRYVIVVLAVQTAFTFASAAPDYTAFGNNTLTLVFEAYEGEVVTNLLPTLPRGERDRVLDGLKVIGFNPWFQLTQGFIVIDDDGRIVKCARPEKEKDILSSSEDGEKYFSCRGRTDWEDCFFGAYPFTKEVHNADGSPGWRHEIRGYPSASDDLDIVAIRTDAYRVGKEKPGNLVIINKRGDVVAKDYPYAGLNVKVSENGERIILSSMGDYVEGIEPGMRVLDANGSLLFNLDPDLVQEFPRYECWDTLYCSKDYIIQSGYRVEYRKGEPALFAEGGKPIIVASSIDNSNEVRAFDSKGKRIWTKPGVFFAPSKGAKYVLIAPGNNADGPFPVVDTAKGIVKYECRLPDLSGYQLNGGWISDNGGTCAISLFMYRHVETSFVPCDAVAFVFHNGEMVAKFEGEFDAAKWPQSPYVIQISHDGAAIAVVKDRAIRIFKISN